MQNKKLALSGAAIGIATMIGAVVVMSAKQPRGNRDDAPGRTARRSRFGSYAVVGKTVTIAKPDRPQLYAFWRDFTNLPAFMANLEAVEAIGDDQWRWTIKAPGGTVAVETVIAEERKDELIAWRSTKASQVQTEGRVTFRDAGERGTQVELIIAYQPPLGAVGRAIATLLQREPEVQARRDLRRFKMLMETGEIATAANRLNLKEAA